MSDLIGLLIAYLAIPAIIAGSQLLLSAHLVDATVARKLIHVGVSHWWLIAIRFHTSVGFALVGPVSFVLINTLVYRYHLLSAMEEPNHQKNLGTIYFPISLIVLVLMSFSGPMPKYVGGIGVLVMGYGDGLASILGTRLGRRRIPFFGGSKSVAGTLTMGVVSTCVVAIWVALFHARGGDPGFLLLSAVSTALVATALELATPFGLDNLTVPIGTACFFLAVFA